MLEVFSSFCSKRVWFYPFVLLLALDMTGWALLLFTTYCTTRTD